MLKIRDAVIRPVRLDDLPGINHAINEICRERRFLGMVKGFPLEVHQDFLLKILRHGWPQVVAEKDELIIGWCDILPRDLDGFRHVGRLGMGVLKPYRGQGIGNALVRQCLEWARSFGLEKVELDVYGDNEPAINLYRKMGFYVEGRKRRARKLDGQYQDIVLMALDLKLDGTQTAPKQGAEDVH